MAVRVLDDDPSPPRTDEPYYNDPSADQWIPTKPWRPETDPGYNPYDQNQHPQTRTDRQPYYDDPSIDQFNPSKPWRPPPPPQPKSPFQYLMDMIIPPAEAGGQRPAFMRQQSQQPQPQPPQPQPIPPQPPPSQPSTTGQTPIQQLGRLPPAPPNWVSADTPRWTPPTKARPTKEIGEDANKGDPFTDKPLPTPEQATQIFGYGAGKNLATFGAPRVALPMTIGSGIARIIGPALALFSTSASTAFEGSYDTATTRRIALQQAQVESQREQMMDAKREGLFHLKEQLLASRQILEDLEGGHITPEQADEAFHKLGTDLHDNTLLTIKSAKGLSGVKHHIDWLDNQFQQELDAFNSLWGGGARTTKKADDPDPGHILDSGNEPSPFSETTGDTGPSNLPPDTHKPTGPATPAAGDQAAPEGPSAEQAEANFSSAIDRTRAQNRLNPGGDRAAQQIARDGVVSGYTDTTAARDFGKAYTNATKTAGEYRNAVSDYLSSTSNNPNISTEDKINAIDKKIPDLGTEIGRISDYSSKVSQDIPSGLRKQYTAWAQRLNPKYKDSGYDEYHQFFKTNDPEYRLLDNANQVPQLAANLLYQVNKLPESEYITWREMKGWWEKGESSKPQWAAAAYAMRAYNSVVSGLEAGSPQARVTLVNLMNKESDTGKFNPNNIRYQILGDNLAIISRIANRQTSFEEYDPKKMVPPVSRDTWLGMDALSRTNPDTGSMPEHAPSHIQNAGKQPSARDIKILGPDRMWKPRTAADLQEAAAQLSEAKKNPQIYENEIQQMTELLNRAKGITAHPLWEWNRFYAK